MERRVAPAGSERRPGTGPPRFPPARPAFCTRPGRPAAPAAPPARPGPGPPGYPKKGRAGHLEQFLGPLQEHLFRDVDVPFPAHGVQKVQQPRGQAGRVRRVEVEAAGQTVGGEKPQAVDVQGQLIGVGGHHLHRLIAILLIDLGGHGRPRPVPAAPHQDLPGRFVGLPILADLVHLLGPIPDTSVRRSG